MNKNEVTDQECLQMGRSILLLGLKRAMSMLQTQADTLEIQLKDAPAVAQNGHSSLRPAMQRTMALIEEAVAPTPTVRESLKKSSQKEYWDQFTPAQRSKEMQRRQRVAAARKKRREAGTGL